MPGPDHPLFARLRSLAADGPIVVAHRGDSSHFAENTLDAFRAALELGCAMQEFDVRSTRDGILVCIHDASLDRTTDAAARLGPGALVSEMGLDALRLLDAGSWHPGGHGQALVPTLAEVLDLLTPASVPLIEHKAGSPAEYVSALRQAGRLQDCILQSFDWGFVAAARQLAPELAVAVLGPTDGDHPDDAAVATAASIGAGMIHWRDRLVRSHDFERIHAAGLLLCTYTTDDEVGMRGGAAMGFDAMCTNVPERMLRLREAVS